MKDESEGKINDEFVGFKSRMYSMKNIDGKESNTAKGMNIPNYFKDAETTCVEIASEMKKCFKLKGKLNFNVL